jgi:hypothetical protein
MRRVAESGDTRTVRARRVRTSSTWIIVALATLCVVAAAYFLEKNVHALPPDFGPVHRGITDAWEHRPPYSEDPGFATYNHPPGSALLLGPITLVSYDLASRAFGLTNFVGVVWLALGTWWFAHRAQARQAVLPWALVVLGLGLLLGARMGRGNVDILTCSLALGALVIVTRATTRTAGRIGAGLLLGAACTLKPYGFAFLPPLLFADGITVAAIAVGVAVVANLVALARFEEASTFFSDVVPYLRNGQPVVRRSDASLSALVSRSNAANSWFRAVGALVFVPLAGYATWVEQVELRRLRPLLLASALFAAAVVLISPSSFPYYWVYLAPALVVLVDWRTRVMAAGALVVILAQTTSAADRLDADVVRLFVDRADVVAFLLLFVAVLVDLLFAHDASELPDERVTEAVA